MPAADVNWIGDGEVQWTLSPTYPNGVYRLLVRSADGQTTITGITVHKTGSGYNPTVVHVTPDPLGTPIQDAINASSGNTLIVVEPGTYFESPLIDKAGVRLQGYGPGQLDGFGTGGSVIDERSTQGTGLTVTAAADTERVLIGRVSDSLILNGDGCQVLDFSHLRYLTPGSSWTGPGTIGLESTIRSDGSLTSGWYRPTDYGQEETQEVIAGPNASLLEGFQKARPGENSGRARITIGGHVITNRDERDGSLQPHYVGRVAPSVFRNWERWIEGR